MSKYLTQYAVVFKKRKNQRLVDKKLKEEKSYTTSLLGERGWVSTLIYMTFLKHYPENGSE